MAERSERTPGSPPSEGVRTGIPLEPAEVSSPSRRRARRRQGFLLADGAVAAERVFAVGNKGTYRFDGAGVTAGLTAAAGPVPGCARICRPVENDRVRRLETGLGLPIVR